MAKTLSMADLLAKQPQIKRLNRNSEVEGEVSSITNTELILDLGSKAEGVLPKRDLSKDVLSNLKIGDKLTCFVVSPENESGQVVLTLQKVFSKGGYSAEKWEKFERILKAHESLTGKGIEVNKGGLIVEVGGVRGFLPSSQVSLSSASDLDSLVGKEITVGVIEVDSSQNRLIFSQRGSVSDEIKDKLKLLKIDDKVKGAVAAVLPFGIFVTVLGEEFKGLEGLVHISELSWEKVDDPGSLYKVGQEIEAKVISVDSDTGRVNLSVRQLTEDPFKALAQKYKSDDVVKGEVVKVSANAIAVKLEDGTEAVLPASKLEDKTPGVGAKMSFLIDNVDVLKHKITLAPFVTSTKGLIYK